MIKEFCAENYTNLEEKIRQGANRIELCDNLTQGGTTPSFGVIKESVKLAHANQLPIMVMIRPRGGSFNYSPKEVDMMLTDIKICKQLRVDGVVFGALAHQQINRTVSLKLIQAAGQLEKTFHMAFDEIEPNRQFFELDWLAQQGVNRVLTHGGPPSTDIMDNLTHLKKLNEYANNRITILAGGGITRDNLPVIHRNIQLSEYHGTRIV